MLKTVLILPVEKVSFQGVVRKAFQGGKGSVVRYIQEAVWGQPWCPISTSFHDNSPTLPSSSQDTGPASRHSAPLVQSMSLSSSSQLSPYSQLCSGQRCAPACVATGPGQLLGPYGCYGEEMLATEQANNGESSLVILSQAWDGPGISAN